MFATILKFGLIAGAVAGGALSLSVALAGGAMGHGWAGMAFGYATMLVALSLVPLAIKRHRDLAGGGVIRFWPAFGLGLAVSAVAGVVYVLAWELTQATLIAGDFAASYADGVVAARRAAGAGPVELAQLRREMDGFVRQYHDPLVRLPMTFLEIFPVGALVSLIAAAVLRRPARR
jgi:hypothetical protein